MDIKAQFFSLTPDRVLDAVEAGGSSVTGLCYPLNSLENRVYEIELEDRSRVVAKFYRPGRWSKDAILDEHQFLLDLKDEEIPACAPLVFPDGQTVREVADIGIWYALFPRIGGRAPEEFDPDQLVRLGALLARIHTVGVRRAASHRRSLTPESYGLESLQQLEAANVLPLDERTRFRAVVLALVKVMTPLFEGVAVHRVHGDCHPGNLLWNNEGPQFLDFDDMVIGPPVQDVWMLVPGRDLFAQRDREHLVVGYLSLRDFDRRSLQLIEPLRALRYLHYAAWITRRWDDLSFPRAFPHYGTAQYWRELIDDLEEQLLLIGGQQLPDSSPRRMVEVRARRIAFGDDDWQRVLTVRTEVMVEELGRDLDAELDGQDRSAIHLLVENAEGHAVGAARLRGPDQDGTLIMDRVAILAEYRRQGFGRALVQEAVEAAGELGQRALRVPARVESIPFFAALDFLVTGKSYNVGDMTYRPMLREW